MTMSGARAQMEKPRYGKEENTVGVEAWWSIATSNSVLKTETLH